MREVKEVKKAWLTTEEARRAVRSVMKDSDYQIRKIYQVAGMWTVEIYYTDYMTEYQLKKLLNEVLPGCSIELHRNLSESAIAGMVKGYWEEDLELSTFDIHDNPVRLKMSDVIYAIANRTDLS